MQQAFPDIKPYWRGQLDINGQQLYLEQTGNPDGLPLLYLHDGPGLGCHPADRCLFDPQRYRILLLDQRGCGQSRPHLQLARIDLDSLLADAGQLRQQLDIERWLLAGVGWGGQLALNLALAEPDSVLGLLLVATGLGSAQERRWLLEQGAPQVYPEAYHILCRGLRLAPEAQAAELLTALQAQLGGGNELEKMAAARYWGQWLYQCTSFRLQHELQAELLDPHVVLALASLQAQFLACQWYQPSPEGLAARLEQLPSVPVEIVHGRYDMVVPLASACSLQEALADASLNIVREAGHSVREPAMIDALVKAQARLAQMLAPRPPDAG